jgi:hypothetical protein
MHTRTRARARARTHTHTRTHTYTRTHAQMKIGTWVQIGRTLFQRALTAAGVNVSSRRKVTPLVRCHLDHVITRKIEKGGTIVSVLMKWGTSEPC